MADLSKRKQINSAENIRALMRRFSFKLDEALKPIVDQALKAWEAGKPIPSAIRRAWVKYDIDRKLELFLKDSVFESFAFGSGENADSLKAATISRTLFNSRWASDNATLIKRLDYATPKMKAAIIDAIQTKIRQGETVNKLSRSLFEGYDLGGKIPIDSEIGDQLPKRLREIYNKRLALGSIDPKLSRDIRSMESYISRLRQKGSNVSGLKSAYEKLLESIKNDTDDQIRKAIDVAIYEKGRYLADRIARTEISRANYEGFLSKSSADPDIVAVKFTLSKSHPEFDICDLHTKADFGLGPGVYPLGTAPRYPFHPHCICLYEEIFRDEVDLKDFRPNNREDGERFLKGLRPIQRLKILGIEGSQEFRNGKDWRGIARNYNGITNNKPTIDLKNVEK